MQRAVRLAARLVIAFGILLNGLDPTMAGMGGQDSHVAHMSAGMPMNMGSSKNTPVKKPPCGGMDCGCCIAGACAAPAIVQAVADVCPSWSLGRAAHDSAALSGITFPPDTRPPISGAIAA